jgi:hypothetical protein
VKQNCLKLKRKDSRLSNTSSNSSGNGNKSNCYRENFESQDMVFAVTSDAEKFDDDIWICDSSVSSLITFQIEVCLMSEILMKRLESDMVISSLKLRLETSS